ncbi:MAG TPA: ATP-binding protein [Lacunisphaera sp.]|nr:ATP-binding protein [Lacunisphaera sp.]
MLHYLHRFLLYRLDLALLILLVAAAFVLTDRHLRRKISRGLSTKIWVFAALLLGASAAIAEWAARDRTDRLQSVFSGFGPTYAAELAIQGHADITTETAPTDPHYLQLIESEKRWLRANPTIADIYTFRRDRDGRVRLIVDSETDYDHNGVIDSDREERTAIGEIYEEATPKFFAALDGSAEFDSDIVADRWGIFVSSYTPILDRNGKVEAAVGIDYPADAWLQSIASARLMVFAVTLVLLAILLTAAAFVSLLSAEVTRRQAVQANLEQASESALAASAAKSEFLALMSHEVRNPLTAILGFASILSDTRLDPKQRRYVDTINRAGTTLIKLLNDILDYTKAESGKIVLEHIAWAPAMLVHEVMELMSIRAEEKGLQLAFENNLPVDLTLMGDPTRVRQILINLASNALKFTAKGQVTVRADWKPSSSKPNHGRLTLAVADTGPGIPAEKIPQLFQAFMQADSSTTRRHGGTGLGLAICHRLSDKMGGSIKLESEVDRGSVFTFTLPCDSIVACSLDARPTRGGTAPSIAVWTRALVIDDTKLNRELLKVMLRRLGVEADVAASGPEALRMAAQNRYGIIFTDLEMPDMDGFTTATSLRNQELLGQHTPIVAVSALTASGTREKCIAAGMDDYITKPVYLPALKSAIEAVMPQFVATQSAPPFPIRSSPEPTVRQPAAETPVAAA